MVSQFVECPYPFMQGVKDFSKNLRILKAYLKVQTGSDNLEDFLYAGGHYLKFSSLRNLDIEKDGEFRSCGKHWRNFCKFQKHHPNLRLTLPTLTNKCPCSHPININCFVFCKLNAKLYVMGNCCINRFWPEGAQNKCLKCDVEKAIEHSRHRLCVKCKAGEDEKAKLVKQQEKLRIKEAKVAARALAKATPETCYKCNNTGQWYLCGGIYDTCDCDAGEKYEREIRKQDEERHNAIREEGKARCEDLYKQASERLKTFDDFDNVCYENAFDEDIRFAEELEKTQQEKRQKKLQELREMGTNSPFKKVYYNIHYNDKEEAKKWGARWDNVERLWWGYKCNTELFIRYNLANKN